MAQPGYELSFAGLALPQITAEVYALLHARISPDYLREVVPVPHYPGKNMQALAWPHWPERPPLRIGDFYYPTGASRWAEAHFVCKKADVDALRAQVLTHAAGSTQATLVLKADPGGYKIDADGNSLWGGIQTSMYLLPPRPLLKIQGITDPTKDNSLYLLSFVDERYFLLLDKSTLGHPDNPISWVQLFTKLKADLSITLDIGTIPGVYGAGPEYDSSYWANYESSSMMLDAAAFNTGRVVVRNLDGTYRMPLVGDNSITGDNPIGVPLAGGNTMDGRDNAGLQKNLEAVFPAAVIVIFPLYLAAAGYIDPRHAVPQYKSPYGNYWGVLNTVSDLAKPYSNYHGINAKVKFLHTDAKAYFEYLSDKDILNDSAVNNLALRLTTDYLDSLLVGGQDQTFCGIHNWAPENIHDVIWHFDAQSAWTRIQRKPWNFWPEQFQQHLAPPTSGGGGSGTSGDDSGGSGASTGTLIATGDGPNCSPYVEIIKVTGDQINGRYPGRVQRRDSSTGIFSDVDTKDNVWVVLIGGGTLNEASPGSSMYAGPIYVLARLMSFEAGRLVYVPAGGGGGGGAGSASGWDILRCNGISPDNPNMYDMTISTPPRDNIGVISDGPAWGFVYQGIPLIVGHYYRGDNNGQWSAAPFGGGPQETRPLYLVLPGYVVSTSCTVGNETYNNY